MEQGRLNEGQSSGDEGIFVFPYVSSCVDAAAVQLLQKLGMFPLLERPKLRVIEYSAVSSIVSE